MVGKSAVLGPVTTAAAEESLRKKQEAWETYTQLMQSGKDVSMNTFLRLTENYLEAKEMLYKKEQENYEQNLELYNKGSLKAAPKQPKPDYSSLINKLNMLVEKYPHVQGIDAVYYILGYILSEQGRKDEAMSIFEEMITKYPTSDYFIEVTFRLGELYFETNQLGDALAAYRHILKFPDSVFYDKALYKIGWIHYKLDKFKEALESFMLTVDLNWREDAKERSVTSEAMFESVMSLSHLNVEQAIDYLKARSAKEYTLIIFTKLGELLIQEARFEEAISVYTAMTKFFPADKNLYLSYQRLADLYERMGDKEANLMTREKLIDQCNPATSWYKQNYPNGSGEVDKVVAEMMIFTSKAHHVKGKKPEHKAELQKAIEGYRKFLALFQKHTYTKEMNLLLAEALFDAERYWEAAREYDKAAQFYQEGSQRGDIAYSAFLASEVIFYKSAGERGQIITYAERLLTTYQKDLSTSDKWAKAIYKIADMHRNLGAFKKAHESLMPLTKDKEAVPAFQKIAELYLAEGNKEAAEETYLRLFNILKSPDMQEKVAQLRYQRGEEHFKAGRYQDAVAKFNKAFDIYPDSKIGEAALMKVGYTYIQTNKINNLVTLTEQIIQKYPASGGAVALLIEAGQKLEKNEPSQSAMLYEKASFMTLDTKDSQKLISAATALYEKNKKYDRIENLYKNHIATNKLSLESNAEITYKLGYIQLKNGKKIEGMETLNQLMKRKGEIGNLIIIKTRLLLMEEKYTTYAEVKLINPFEETLKKKTQLLDSLLIEYSDLAKQNDPGLLTEVLFRMAAALENFKDSLINSERPSELTKEELEEYNFLLEEKAYPYDEQAVKAYEKVIHVGRNTMVFNQWVQNSLERLSILRPALYKRDFTVMEMEPVFIYPKPVKLGGRL